MVVDKILAYLSSKESYKNDHLKYEIGKLAEWSFQRQFMEEQEDRPFTLRLSSCGKCPRQLAYGYWAFEPNGKEIDGRGRITFFQGDMIELMTTALAKVAGCNIMATGFSQLSIKLTVQYADPKCPETISEANIAGHPDGILIDDGLCLVEVKSMSSYSYDSFERGNIDESYLSQVNIYMNALGIKKCVFIAINKNNGVMNERIVNYDEKIAKEAIANLTTVLTSTKDNLPKARYEADKKGNYVWNCLYCSHTFTCHPNAEKVLVGKAYKLREKPAPKTETKLMKGETK